MGFRAAASSVAARFSVDSVKASIDKWMLSGVLLKVTMNIKNESGIALPIDGFTGRIKYGNQVLAPIVLQNPTTIQSGAVSSVPFNALISYAGLGANIVTMIQSKQFLNNLTIEGVVSSSGVNVPFNKNIVALG